jgi:heat-inducible transcriptional repressor
VDGIITRSIAALEPERAAAGGEPEVFVGGAARIARGFDTVETVRAVLGVLEEHLVVVSLLREALERSASVSIGTEHGADSSFEQLAACSVVVAPYTVDGRKAGTIGVLGPTRMNYPAVMSAVADVSAQLSNRLSEG